MKGIIFSTILLSSIVFQISTTARATEPVIYPDDPYFLKRQFIPRTYHPEHISKKPGHYTITDWGDVIDSTWGWGLSRTAKLQIFDTFWQTMDDDFAAFVNLPGYYSGMWDDLRSLYRTEIENGDPTYGVSRGRFAAIMNYLAMALLETHTNAVDIPVSQNTYPDPGVPLFFVGSVEIDEHFGAGLTPLDDSTLLVYKTIPNHPLGLEPGDRVLGYDGMPWSDLSQQLSAAQLPVFGWWGSSEYTFDYQLMIAAGLNWHLFDTLDVVKYSTGDTAHLSTAPLVGGVPMIQITEQMDIPGVPMPDLWAGGRVTFGIINGTQIGYIYVFSWSGNVDTEFYNALGTLMDDYETTGLIIDYRMNYGGNFGYPLPGLSLIYNTRESTIDQGGRCSSNDHLSMCPRNIPGTFEIPGIASNYYDRPIAVLVGPGAGSVGDQVPLWMKSHPMVRLFGRPTAGAYTSVRSLNLGNSDWFCRYTPWNTFLTGDPNNYLTHGMISVDEDVWLTPDDVAQGYDTVVEAAEAWINSFTGLQPEIAYGPDSIEISLGYGQTATQDLSLQNLGSRHLFFSLTPQTENRLWLSSDKDNSVFVSMPSREFDLSTGEDISKPGAKNEPLFPPVISGHGGPEAYGHIWIDSDQPHGPSSYWIDISGTGTEVRLGDNSYGGPYPIGFDFPFYENTYSQLYVGSNGVITFGGGSVHFNNVGIPNSGSPNNLIALWWDDLNPSVGGQIYYYSDAVNGRFIVSFEGVPRYDVNGSSLTFQAVLSPDGQIDLNYNTMDWGNRTFSLTWATIGIENSDGSDGLEVIYNARYIHDNLTIRILSDWMGITPYAGHIAVGEGTMATITFNSGNFPPGSYTGNIYLDSNDPLDTLILIPVSLEIASTCDYVVGDVNGDDSYNALDITYGVNYFKGGSVPVYECECSPGESWYIAGDVNGSCDYNGLDITYGVSYFKGGDDPLPCSDCPPE